MEGVNGTTQDVINAIGNYISLLGLPLQSTTNWVDDRVKGILEGLKFYFPTGSKGWDETLKVPRFGISTVY